MGLARRTFFMAAWAAAMLTGTGCSRQLERPVYAQAAKPVRTIEIHAKQYKFVPSEITLKKGEPVKLVLWSDDVPHSLAVAGLPIHAEMVKEEAMSVTLTPSRTGNYPGKCSKFCGPGHRDMHFVVHVVD